MKYQVREIMREKEDGSFEFKKVRVYDSIQHIWNQVIFTVSKKNKNLGEGWFLGSHGMNVNFTKVIFN